MRLNTFKRIGLLLTLSLLSVVPASAQSTNSTENKIQLGLMAQIAQIHLLTPSAPTLNATIDIDAAQKVNIIFGSPSKTLNIELISPSGKRFSSGNIDYAGVSSLVFPEPSAPQTTGANYAFVLTNPQPGKWSYVIQETAPLTKKRAVLMSLFSSSLIRAGMLSAALDNRVNSDVILGLVVAEGQNFLKNVSINATLAKINDPAFKESTCYLP